MFFLFDQSALGSFSFNSGELGVQYYHYVSNAMSLYYISNALLAILQNEVLVIRQHSDDLVWASFRSFMCLSTHMHFLHVSVMLL